MIMSKAKKLAEDIISLIEEFEKQSPDLIGELVTSKGGTESWSLHLDQHEVKVVIDVGSSVVYLNEDNIRQMKAAIEFFTTLEPKQRRIMMNILDSENI